MSREIIHLRTLALVGAFALVAVGQASNPGLRDARQRDTASKGDAARPVGTALVAPAATTDGQASLPEAVGALPEAILAPPVRVYFNNFDDPEFLAGGVTGGVTLGGAAEPVQGYAGLGQAGDQFAGKFWRNATTGNPAQMTRLILYGLPVHRSINLRFLLAIIDSWDGSGGPDYFNVIVNGTSVFYKTIGNPVAPNYVPPPGGQLTWNTQRGFNGSYADAAYDMTLDPTFAEIPHSASILAIDFFASGGGWEGGSNESWAIENLEVLISDMGPEPAPPFTDAISREVSVFMPERPVSITDAISREVSVFAYEGPHPLFTDAVSREVSVYTTPPPVEITDAISREVSVFSVIPITLGTPYQGALPVGSQAYFRLTTPGDLTARITLDHASTTAWTQLYASFGKLPADAGSDFVFSNPSAPDQEVTISNTQAGTYYLLVRPTNDSNPSASKAFTLLAAGVPFGVDGVQPPIVGAGEEVTLRVTGGHLDSANSICLHPSGGGADICPVKTNVLDGAHARLRFNLLGAPLGAYDVVSESPNSQRVLEHAVTLQPPDAIRLDQLVIPSPPLARRHGTIQGTTHIILRNPTNVDVPFTFVHIFAPADPHLTLTLDGPEPHVFVETEIYEDGQFVLESIAPGDEVVLAVKIDIDRAFRESAVRIYSRPLALTRAQVRDGYLLGEGQWFDKLMESYRRQHGTSPEFEEWVSALRFVIGASFDVYGFDLPNSVALAASAVDIYEVLDCKKKCRWFMAPCSFCAFCARAPWPYNAICAAACGAGCVIYAGWHYDDCVFCCEHPSEVMCTGCPSEPYYSFDCGECDQAGGIACCCPIACDWEPEPVCSGCSRMECEWRCSEGLCSCYFCSADPNAKAGSQGYGEQEFVKSSDPLVYRVYFENMETATAPAAEVIVTDALDPALDVSSFRVRKFHFGATTVDVPEGRSAFCTILDFPEMNLLVELCGSIDPPTHKATFTLRALDPDTRQLPSELDRGFLPPNDDTGRGEGYVEFTMKPLVSAVHTGTVIRNKATILFDFNDPITTNEVSNTIDSGAPTSSVAALPTQSLSPFVVRWNGQDDGGGSGIGNYAVSVKTDNAAFVPWRSSTGTWGYFAGEVGKTYAFYTVATDNVGNVEGAPPQGDATTAVTKRWIDCLAGPGAQPPAGCAAADLDRDSDVDLKDFAALQLGVVPAPPP